MPRPHWIALSLTTLSSSAHAANRTAALIDAGVFFGGLFALLIVALVLRVRDARAGLSPEERQARMKRRLPWIMGAFFGLCLYSVLRFG